MNDKYINKEDAYGKYGAGLTPEQFSEVYDRASSMWELQLKGVKWSQAEPTPQNRHPCGVPIVFPSYEEKRSSIDEWIIHYVEEEKTRQAEREARQKMKKEKKEYFIKWLRENGAKNPLGLYGLMSVMEITDRSVRKMNLTESEIALIDKAKSVAEEIRGKFCNR